jgi:hypothetical protein
MNNKDKIRRDFIGEVDIDLFISILEKIKNEFNLKRSRKNRQKEIMLRKEWINHLIKELNEIKINFEEKNTEIKELNEKIKK